MDAAFLIRAVFVFLTAVVTSYIHAELRRTETALLRQELNEASVVNAALEHHAQHDLFDLATQIAQHRIASNRLLQHIRRKGRIYALILLDLDRFKDANDTLGHRFGDCLLQQIGPRTRAVIVATS